MRNCSDINPCKPLKAVKRLLTLQLIICVAMTIAMLFMGSQKAAISALVGGLVALIPNLLFAHKLFQYQGARAAKQIIKSFYLGEFLKLLSTMILFALVFYFLKISPLPFFMAYILVLMSHWLTPLIFNQ